MKPVTGPDEDNPITDEQIREEMKIGDTPITGNGFVHACQVALGEARFEGSYLIPRSKVDACRSRVAQIFNARHGAKP
jgi:hypothetical protein